ncbi:response regulator [Paenibacillaceae bacterium]|nr:response regulator [Paenibacillaceae bacterium]
MNPINRQGGELLNILIIDDEKFIREGVKRTIASAFSDANIRIAGSAHEAVDLIEATMMDIILLDIKMPGMSGLELLGQYRKLNQRTKWIVISAYSDFYFAQEALRCGARDYLLKPVGKPKLQQLITEMQLEIQEERKEESQRLSANHLSELLEEPGKEPDLIDIAMQYIQANFDDNLTLEKVAATIYLNPVYFSQLFKQKTGRGFKDYVIELRMNRAKKLLEKPRLRVSDVAERVGYQDMRYFTQVFRKTFCITPTEYRKGLGLQQT